MIKISKNLKKNLWEYDINKLKYTDEILIIRALNFGEIEDIKIICKEIGEEKVIDVFKKNLEQIDSKSKNFWKVYFNLNNLKNTKKTMYDKLNKNLFTRSFG